jgi:hypothetical protein
VRRPDPRTQIIGGWTAAETVILQPVTESAAHPEPLRAAGRRAARPVGIIQRVVRFLDRRGYAKLLHLQSPVDGPCTALAEVRAPGSGMAQFAGRLRLAAEPSLPRTANMRTLTVVSVQRLSPRRWHVHMEFRRGR